MWDAFVRLSQTLHPDTLLPPVTPHFRTHGAKCFVNTVEAPSQRGKLFKCEKMVKNCKANEQATLGTGVIKLRLESEWKALPFWTHNTLQALITDTDKQMSGYHSQHARVIVTGDRKKILFTPIK